MNHPAASKGYQSENLKRPKGWGIEPLSTAGGVIHGASTKHRYSVPTLKLTDSRFFIFQCGLITPNS